MLANRTFTEWLNFKPSKLDEKIKYFEYFVIQLVRNTKDLKDLKSRNYSDLKVMLLLFFTCATDTKLLKIFDNWHAKPHGHIEQDLWNYIKQNKGEFSFFRLTRFGIELKK